MCKRVEPEFVSSWGNGEGLQLLHQTLYALEEIGGGGGGGGFVREECLCNWGMGRSTIAAAECSLD